jgi:T4 RnlA family RNA ligase
MSNTKTHKYYLPTYEECRSMCDAHDNLIFHESKHVVDGYNVSIFNYRLAQWLNFENPLDDGSDVTAYELRGLTFVFNVDGTLFDRFLLLDKFFNIDQTPCSMFSIIKDFKIERIFNKEDGSIASFVKLPNGSVKGKSKASFISEQAVGTQKIYDTDENIKRVVDYFLFKGITPVFEYVSPDNKIVVPYTNTDLILLQLRDNKTGEYLKIEDYSHILDGVSVVPTEIHTLDDLISLRDIVKDKEGWVIQFSNGKMVKLKTEWYFNLHNLFTEELNRENLILNMIFEETIDDAISLLGDDVTSKETKERISEITDIVNFKIKVLCSDVNVLLKEYGGDKKSFSLKYHKHILFSLAVGVINGKDLVEMATEFHHKKTTKLMEARKWLETSKEEYYGSGIS